MKLTEKELRTITIDMQTASDNCIEYEKLGLRKNADYQRAYLHGMIRIANILGYCVGTNDRREIELDEMI